MSGARNTTTSQIIQWLNRNSLAFTTNRTPADAWNAYLSSVVGGSQTATKSLEEEWLKTRIVALGATPPTAGTASDLWRAYLQKKGHTGDMVDMFNQWIDHGTP